MQLSLGLDELVFSNKAVVLNVRERNALRDGIFESNRVLSRMAWSFHRRGMAYCNFAVKNHYRKDRHFPEARFLLPRRRFRGCDQEPVYREWQRCRLSTADRQGGSKVPLGP